MRQIASKKLALFGATIIASAPVLAQDLTRQADLALSLEAQFQDPPASARPRVWWHWLDGNISENGIRKDLEWMKRVGIGGVQAFDGNFDTPLMVKRRLAFMTPEWKRAFRFAASEADRLGLELAIAASPGWSHTGGPWVKPQDGMKKLVWSETVVPGGRRFHSKLPAPPHNAGLYQNQVLEDAHHAPDAYGDVAVFAHRTDAKKAPLVPAISTGDGQTINGRALTDGDFATGVLIPRESSQSPAVIMLDYGRPRQVQSATLFVAGSADVFFGAYLAAKLEAEAASGWQKVADLTLSTVPTTISFAPRSARRFRVVLAPREITRNNNGPAEPGYASPPPGSTRMDAGLKLREFNLSSEARVNHAELKAGFAVASNYFALDGDRGSDLPGVRPEEVFDLTARMAPDGTLDWTPPAGTWRVVRLGYSLTGKTNHPATPEATGLEVDKIDAAAVRRYMTDYLSLYRDAVGGELIGKAGLRAIVTDSSEVGAFNWSAGLFDQFKVLRGYDMRPWLPALTGQIVGSRSKTDGFLYDFRRTLGELHTSVLYGTVAQVARENGLKVYSEALEGWRTSLGDDLDMRRHADVPMAALWVFRPNEGPRPFYLTDMRGAASVAHQAGTTQVAAEVMTSTAKPWAHAPADLRRIADMAFANGINLPIIHTSVHQPVDDHKPGLSMRNIGHFFTRHETWAEMARPWVDYLVRSSHLLQQGRPVADVAYFYGEETPVGEQAQGGYFTDVPARNGYDFVSPSALRDLFRVQDGNLVTPGGARYRLLYLSPASEQMTLPTLRKIADLVAAGATVVGMPPAGSPSLADDAAEFAALVAKLWSGGSNVAVGKGRVIKGRDVDQALQDIGVAPDVSFPRDIGSDLVFTHRQLADGELFFLNNRGVRRDGVEARFRVTGKEPEIWRADSATITPATYRTENGETVVPLTFESEESYFVVFRKPAAKLSRVVPADTTVVASTIEGPWTVDFEQDRGAPEKIEMPALAPLNELAEAGVRYFSGISTYSRRFTAPREFRAGSRLTLDLGQVGDVAQVRVNGQLVGTAWHAPYRVDVGRATRRGENRIEIKVANLWRNRLIGDAQPGASKVAYTVSPTYTAEAPLRPAGLIGPVRLLMSSPRE